MFSGSNTMVVGGTFSNYQNRVSRGMDILMEWVATGAFHDSDELYDTPKCHPRTRVAVLEDIMQWVESESARDDFMLWLFGAAGAGKSAIAKRIAEIAAERDLLIADFFFSRTSSTRNTKDRLIATLAYQLTLSVPATRSYIEEAIERDPAIFNKNIETQINTLLIKPFQSISSNQIFPRQKLIIIDGLDECNDSQSQVAILEAISHSFARHKLPIIFLVASRPEPDLDTSFNCNESLRYIHRRLALDDDTYHPDDDVRLFFSDKFDHIRRTHRLRSTIPVTWPTEETLDTLVSKSSGQFIYASTVVKFVESRCHRPTARLNIILGISPPGSINPFAELDAIYHHLLSSVDDIHITLRVLSLYVMNPLFVSGLDISGMPPELFLALEPADIQLALMNLSSILTYHETSGWVTILHASLVDFLSDKHRSNIFYIDMPRTCTDFFRRILQYVKGPDGIQAGNISLFSRAIDLTLFPCVFNDQLQSDILNFDLDAFINASIRWLYYKEHPFPVPGSTRDYLAIWRIVLHYAGLEDGAKKEALDRLHKSLESRIQIYQSDWRLYLLLALETTKPTHRVYGVPELPHCRCLDIFLEMLDDHYLHIADQNALDLRHVSRPSGLYGDTIDIPSYVNGDMYVSVALHSMRFLCSPPKYFDQNDYPEIGIMYMEWRGACDMALQVCCNIFPQANTSPELVQFISNHDIHLSVQKHFSPDRLWEVDMHILAFLSQADVCVNWRIISAIQRFLGRRLPSQFEGLNDASQTPDATSRDLIKRRLDRCCSNTYH